MTSTTPASSSVLLTGASTGIGHATAVELARLGYRVFAGVRRDDDAQELAQCSPAQIEPVKLDVTDAQAVQSAVGFVAENVSETGLAGLVNNAGIGVVGPLELVPLEEWRQQLEVNVLGTVAVTQACMPLLRAGRGRVVNISSVSGLVAAPFFGPYSASKFALEAMSDSLRLEVRRFGMHVSLIEPGPVQTPIWKKSRARVDDRIEHAAPDRVALYDSDLEAVRRAGSKSEQQAIPVDPVVRAIVHAIRAKRPRARYTMPRSERFTCGLLRSLPVGLRDWLLRKAMGLP